ncbi:PREDICTED: cell division control protein 45 homolog, partial [Amphimedon queenslandica]|uniref:CDC45-like protein n=2 Tax=Amphimedon queenslandica TaxID=400682 RepID=A0AAN0IWA5_AMPQE
MKILDQEIVSEFYEKLRHQHVLVLAAWDVDSVCACKILQYLFKSDNIAYTLIPVSDIRDLQKALIDHSGQSSKVVLINCGGGVNIHELIESDERNQFFIIDSYRPLEIDNIYSPEQVNVVIDESEHLKFPEYDEIYASDMDSDDEGEGPSNEEFYYEGEEEEEEDEGPDTKRRRLAESFQKRRKKVVWKKNRQQVLLEYNGLSYHGTAASILMYQLALKMSRDSNEVLWWSIIGLTEQYLYEKISSDSYTEKVHTLRPDVLRLNRNDQDTASSINRLRLTLENELPAVLYRHWSLYDSLSHSQYISCWFKTWSMRGHKKFLEFLADMGLPLSQSKQPYSAMDASIQENVKDWITSSALKFGMDNITYSSFVSHIGYKHHFSAADMVYCVSAFLENNVEPSFLSAIDVLSKGNVKKIFEGIELAKQQQKAIIQQARSFTEKHRVGCAGSFMYFYVEENTPNCSWFVSPITLKRLAYYLRETWNTTNRKAKDLP